MWFSLINRMFNFCINNIVGEPIINKVFKKIFSTSLRKIVQEEDSYLALEISVFMTVLL